MTLSAIICIQIKFVFLHHCMNTRVHIYNVEIPKYKNELRKMIVVANCTSFKCNIFLRSKAPVPTKGPVCSPAGGVVRQECCAGCSWAWRGGGVLWWVQVNDAWPPQRQLALSGVYGGSRGRVEPEWKGHPACSPVQLIPKGKKGNQPKQYNCVTTNT